eukprot:scaffold113_cov339-Pavlova_lutheri.AAC.25
MAPSVPRSPCLLDGEGDGEGNPWGREGRREKLEGEKGDQGSWTFFLRDRLSTRPGGVKMASSKRLGGLRFFRVEVSADTNPMIPVPPDAPPGRGVGDAKDVPGEPPPRAGTSTPTQASAPEG